MLYSASTPPDLVGFGGELPNQPAAYPMRSLQVSLGCRLDHQKRIVGRPTVSQTVFASLQPFAVLNVSMDL